MEDRNAENGKSEDKVGSSVLSQKERVWRAAEELKQQIKAKAATLKRYKNKGKQYRQNRLFQSNQSKFYQELDGKSHEENIIQDKEKTREFWSGIWVKDIKYNESADWIQKVAEEMQGNKQQNIEITLTEIKERIRMVKWQTVRPQDLMVSMAIGSRCLCQCEKKKHFICKVA